MVASGSESLRIGENNGILGIKSGLWSDFVFLNPAVQIKTDIIPPNACLQYSITPVFHHSSAYENGSANLLYPFPKDQVFRVRLNT